MTDRTPLRQDLKLIADLIPANARVLDIGCGDGTLLEYLVREKGIDARGMELSQRGVNDCVARGLAVVQGDADLDLADYPTDAFDVVILSKTLQATHRPKHVLAELLRIGRKAIVSIPNFGHWRVRLALLRTGRMPVTSTLALPWHSTPNIHFCTISDFLTLCDELELRLETFLPIGPDGRPLATRSTRLANLTADQALFLLTTGAENAGV